MPAGNRPRVGISRCLLGDEVRYDGTHKRDARLVDALSRHEEGLAQPAGLDDFLGRVRAHHERP